MGTDFLTYGTQYEKLSIVDSRAVGPDTDVDTAFQVNPDPDLDPDPIRIQRFNDQRQKQPSKTSST